MSYDGPGLPKGPLYIALQDLDFAWTERRVEQVIQLWRAGKHIRDIAKAVRRTQEEATVLIMSLALESRIEERPGGALGVAG